MLRPEAAGRSVLRPAVKLASQWRNDPSKVFYLKLLKKSKTATICTVCEGTARRARVGFKLLASDLYLPEILVKLAWYCVVSSVTNEPEELKLCQANLTATT